MNKFIIDSMDESLVPYVSRIETMNDDVYLYKFLPKIANTGLDAILGLGWCIISNWIEPEYSRLRGDMCVNNVSFRFGKGNMRMIVVADVYIPEHETVILNVDSNEPGSVVGLVPTDSNELWKLRLVGMVGYGPCSNGRPGLGGVVEPPRLMIAGLDIEVSTYARGGNMPLPHDPIISIAISNGAWYDKTCEDVCVCIYTFGHHKDVDLGNGRRPVFIKARSSAHAVEVAYSTLNLLGYDFINIHNAFGFDLKHLAAVSAELDHVSGLFERKRLGNFGTGTFMRLKNGTMFVDSMYTAMKTSRPGQWSSFSLAHMAERLGLPPKLDVAGMMIEESEDYDVTQMLVYNCRDSDLHAWLVKEEKTCEHICICAGLGKGSIQDSIANNVGMLVFCMQQSLCLSVGSCLDLSPTLDSDERRFEGGYVLEPTPGCYRGVIMIDGNSLYGTIMSKLGIFVDRCVSSPTLQGLREKMGVPLPEDADAIKIDGLMSNDHAILMRTGEVYLGIIRGGPTILSRIVDMLVTMRASAKLSGNQTQANACKLMTTSLFGTTGSPHGALSSKTCAEIITYLARCFLKLMIEVARWCGYDVIYGDTDSIFVHVGGETELACTTAAMRVKRRISEYTKGTIFEHVTADVKGNYETIIISSKKKYEGVFWDGSLDTKGLAPVKKDTLPIVRYVMKKALAVLNSKDTKERKTEILMSFIGGVMLSVQNGALPVRAQVIEKRINCQPHIVYVDSDGKDRSILVDIGEQVTNVSKTWVARRITTALDGLLIAMQMNTVSEMLFAFESRRLRSSRLGMS